jgi:glucose/arabinose dehydrogenase
MRFRLLAVVLGLVLPSSAGSAVAQQPRAHPGGAPPPDSGPIDYPGFVRVVDGDSVEIRLGGTQVLVGLIGVDTPAGNTACGREAAAVLRALTRDGVRLEEESGLLFDTQGRRLYYAVTRDGRSIALALVSAGVARAVPQGRESAQLAAAEDEARAAQRGCLWREPRPMAAAPLPSPAAAPVPGPIAAATVVPGDFTQDTVTAGLIGPTSFIFLPDGRILATEQRGTVRVVEGGALLAAPMIDIGDRVNDYLDRGLLGIAADPDFTANGFIYLLYTFENDPDDYGGRKTARLARYTAVGNAASPASEVVLLGTAVGRSCNDFPDGTDCIPSDSPSHSVGTVTFAADGTLFVSTGDGAHYNFVDEDALRAQDLDLLAGKMLRITTDGRGVPDNPFWTGDPDANRSKVWAYGLRNAYRFNLRPGTLTPYLGDVGWGEWEEIDVAARGVNLGWPCYEGDVRQSGYEPLAVCQALYSRGPGAVRGPLVAWDHSSGSVTTFATDADGPVDIEMGPDGNLYYLAINAGELRRFRYTGDMPPPGGTRCLSDLVAVSEVNGWGPVERDASNGELAAGDGGPLRLRGVAYAKGLGVHAVSDLRYTLGGRCQSFTAVIGVDDEVGGRGSVVFQVWADGVRLFDIGVLTGTSAAVPVSVGVAGRAELQPLETEADGSPDFDHADWADARLACG